MESTITIQTGIVIFIVLMFILCLIFMMYENEQLRKDIKKQESYFYDKLDKMNSENTQLWEKNRKLIMRARRAKTVRVFYPKTELVVHSHELPNTVDDTVYHQR